jgi:hypothetical protein
MYAYINVCIYGLIVFTYFLYFSKDSLGKERRLNINQNVINAAGLSLRKEYIFVYMNII